MHEGKEVCVYGALVAVCEKQYVWEVFMLTYVGTECLRARVCTIQVAVMWQEGE